MAVTLNAVAAVARRMMNLEKERWLLNAMRFAKNDANCMAVKIIDSSWPADNSPVLFVRVAVSLKRDHSKIPRRNRRKKLADLKKVF